MSGQSVWWALMCECMSSRLRFHASIYMWYAKACDSGCCLSHSSKSGSCSFTPKCRMSMAGSKGAIIASGTAGCCNLSGIMLWNTTCWCKESCDCKTACVSCVRTEDSLYLHFILQWHFALQPVCLHEQSPTKQPIFVHLQNTFLLPDGFNATCMVSERTSCFLSSVSFLSLIVRWSVSVSFSSSSLSSLSLSLSLSFLSSIFSCSSASASVGGIKCCSDLPWPSLRESNGEGENGSWLRSSNKPASLNRSSFPSFAFSPWDTVELRPVTEKLSSCGRSSVSLGIGRDSAKNENGDWESLLL